MIDEISGATLRAIGIVKNEITKATRLDSEDVVSDIVIDESLTEALDNLDEFSHIIVLYWMHEIRGDYPKKVHPMRRPDIPLKGVFATRSPNRPNSIGKATVKLLERQGNVLKVEGLDAINGTPVIDIKPYIPGYDSVENAKTPSWVIRK